MDLCCGVYLIISFHSPEMIATKSTTTVCTIENDLTEKKQIAYTYLKQTN